VVLVAVRLVDEERYPIECLQGIADAADKVLVFQSLLRRNPGYLLVNDKSKRAEDERSPHELTDQVGEKRTPEAMAAERGQWWRV
jgi:hypothetical protein